MLNLLLRVNQRGAHERLLLNLNFALTGLEYQVQEVPDVEGCQNSEWLQFLHPLSDAPATLANIQTSVGQIVVPVPLRAFPESVSMAMQSSEASASTLAATTVAGAKY
jgi:hypothetical protein